MGEPRAGGWDTNTDTDSGSSLRAPLKSLWKRFTNNPPATIVGFSVEAVDSLLALSGLIL